MAAERIFVFDACAILALLHKEPGAEVVAGLLEGGVNHCFVHAVNACEVYYDFHRRGGEAAASSVTEILESSGIALDSSLDITFWQAAGRLKAQWRRVSLADCFALTLTVRKKGTLVTSDRHELERISQTDLCPVLFIR